MKIIYKLLLTTAISGIAFSSNASNTFNGFYMGAKIGTIKSTGSKVSTVSDTSGTYTFSGQRNYSKSHKYAVTGGIQGGYLKAVAPRVVIGAGLGIDFSNTESKYSYNVSATNQPSTNVKQRYIINLLGQVGYTLKDKTMTYLLLGASHGSFKLSMTGENPADGTHSKKKSKLGFTWGLGLSHAISSVASANIQYTSTHYSRVKHTTPAFATLSNRVSAKSPNVYHAVTVGVNFKI